MTTSKELFVLHCQDMQLDKLQALVAFLSSKSAPVWGLAIAQSTLSHRGAAK